jgi:hypothetical protein
MQDLYFLSRSLGVCQVLSVTTYLRLGYTEAHISFTPINQSRHKTIIKNYIF